MMEFERGVGVHRRPDKVTCLGGVERRARSALFANFADHDNVRRHAEHRGYCSCEGFCFIIKSIATIHSYLRASTNFILGRVLNRYYLC